MFRSLPPLLLVSLLLGTSATPASGQSLIPRDLALGLASGYESAGSDARFAVAELPDGVPSEAVPAGAEILGGVSSPWRSAAVIIIPGSFPEVQTALATLEEPLRQHGWEAMWMGAGPFIAPGRDQQRPAGVLPIFCRDGRMLRLVLLGVSLRPGAATLRIETDHHGPPRDCASTFARSVAQAPVPELQIPDGSSLAMHSSSGGEYGYDVRGEVVTTLSPGELLAVFGEQLRDAGWSLGDSTIVESAASQPLGYIDSQGREWRGLLGIGAVPGFEAYQVLLRVSRDAAP